MPVAAWQLDTERGSRMIELEHGYWSGNRVISVDGREVFRARKLFDTGSDHAFTVESHECVVRIRTNGLTFKYQLFVDGVSIDTGEGLDQVPAAEAAPENQMKRDLRGWGLGLVIMGLASFLMADRFSGAWGGILAGMGAYAPLDHWTVLGGLQVYWARQEFQKYKKYAAIEP